MKTKAYHKLIAVLGFRLYPTFKEWKQEKRNEEVREMLGVYILPLRNENCN